MPRILTAAFFAMLLAIAAPQAHADDSKTPIVNAADHVLGKSTAPVTIFEYASLTCPHCAAFEKEKFPNLRKDWIDTGKAKLVLRDFPLDGVALRAAAIAACAPGDRYFAFIESFFDDQENWATAKDPIMALKGIARLGGMDSAAVDKCLADTKLQEAIVSSMAQAQKDYGVESTPTFFVVGANGVSTRLVGDLPWGDFVKALNEASPTKS